MLPQAFKKKLREDIEFKHEIIDDTACRVRTKAKEEMEKTQDLLKEFYDTQPTKMHIVNSWSSYPSNRSPQCIKRAVR